MFFVPAMIAALVFLAHATPAQEPGGAVPASFGLDPLGKTPEAFAPGIVYSPRWEYGVTFSPVLFAAR